LDIPGLPDIPDLPDRDQKSCIPHQRTTIYQGFQISIKTPSKNRILDTLDLPDLPDLPDVGQKSCMPFQNTHNISRISKMYHMWGYVLKTLKH